MQGIVLCGGLSTRMGSDKGLQKLEGNAWAQIAKTTLATLNIPVKISINKGQLEKYAALFSPDDLITDDASLPVKGPLLGVLSAHLKFPGDDLFILACDMLRMETSVLTELYTLYRQHPVSNAYVFSNDSDPEPLCGIYTSKGLSLIDAMIKSGQTMRYSMKFVLEQLDAVYLELKSGQKEYFRNFNTPL